MPVLYVGGACAFLWNVSPVVIPPSFQDTRNSRECWTYDSYRTYGSRSYQSHILLFKFKQMTQRISNQSFALFSYGKKLLSMKGNCPIFKYWLSNQEKCKKIQSMGYLSASADCSHPSDALFSEFVFAFFRRHFRFREAFVNSVNEVLAPVQASLEVDRDKPFLPPFRKAKNLVSVHARFGGKMSDFGDSFTFLDKKAVPRFYSCIMRKNTTDDFVYVASDSSRAKRQLKELLKDKYLDSNRKAAHSGLDWHRKRHTSGVEVIHDASYSAFIDIVISSMASQFVGTEASTFSSMIAMLGQTDSMYLYKNYKPCHQAELYLP